MAAEVAGTPTGSARADVWAIGAAYEPYVGRWSRLVARELLGWLAIPPERRWLDVGCGTGALSASILAHSAPREVVGIDPSDGYVAYAREHVVDPRVRFEVGDARALPCETGAFDAVVSGLVLNFVPEPQRAVAEMGRVCRQGGIVAAYVWDYADGMQAIRAFWDAAIELSPSAREVDEAVRFPLCTPDGLEKLLEGAGLLDVSTCAVDASRPSATSTTTGRRS